MAAIAAADMQMPWIALSSMAAIAAADFGGDGGGRGSVER